jgi:hypothetical protein
MNSYSFKTHAMDRFGVPEVLGGQNCLWAYESLLGKIKVYHYFSSQIKLLTTILNPKFFLHRLYFDADLVFIPQYYQTDKLANSNTMCPFLKSDYVKDPMSGIKYPLRGRSSSRSSSTSSYSTRSSRSSKSHPNHLVNYHRYGPVTNVFRCNGHRYNDHHILSSASQYLSYPAYVPASVYEDGLPYSRPIPSPRPHDGPLPPLVLVPTGFFNTPGEDYVYPQFAAIAASADLTPQINTLQADLDTLKSRIDATEQTTLLDLTRAEGFEAGSKSVKQKHRSRHGKARASYSDSSDSNSESSDDYQSSRSSHRSRGRTRNITHEIYHHALPFTRDPHWLGEYVTPGPSSALFTGNVSVFPPEIPTFADLNSDSHRAGYCYPRGSGGRHHGRR